MKPTRIFDFYWNEFLSSATGNAKDLGPDKRYYGTISDAAPMDKRKQKYITASTEAFAVVTFENNRHKWTNLFPLIKKHGKKYTLQPGKRGAEGGQETLIEGKILYFYGPKFEPKWNKADVGSSRHGGFSDMGKTRFNALRKMANAARKKETTKALEKKFLDELRVKMKLTAPTADEEKANKKRKRDEAQGRIVDNSDLIELDEDEFCFSSSGEEYENEDDEEDDEDDEAGEPGDE